MCPVFQTVCFIYGVSRGKKQVSVVVDYLSRVNGKSNTFKAKLLEDNAQPAAMPAWAQERQLQCELAPR